MRLLLASCGLALLAACGGDTRSTLDRIRERGELVIGTEPEFPPFESVDADGEFVGFDMDMARELAKDLGVHLRIEAMAFDALPSALKSGHIDLILSGMTANEERAKSLAFTRPYFHTKLCFLVHVDSGIETPADADGKRIAVKIGTTGEMKAQELYEQARIVKYEAEGICALEVANHRADAFLYDRHSVLRHQRQHPETTRVVLESVSEEPYAMAARLGDTAFVERLDAFLATLRADGRYAALYEKHFGEAPDDAAR